MFEHRSSPLTARSFSCLCLLLASASVACEDDLPTAGDTEHDPGMEPERDAGGSTADARTNRAPVLGTYRVTTPEDQSLETDLPATDDDGDALEYTLLDEPDHGALQFDSETGHIIYTPEHNYFGEDTFTFRVSDGELSSAIGTVIISITAVNDPPLALDQHVETPEDTPVEVELKATDPDADSLSYVIVGQPEHGRFVATSDTAFVYTPAANFAGTDRVTFKASDGPLESATATITLVVDSVVDAPSATDDRIHVNEGGTSNTLVGGAPSLLANDVNVEDTALVVQRTPVTAPRHGTVLLAADGLFLYEHDGSETASDAFVYRVCAAAAPESCADANVQVTVSGVNDPPAGVADGLTLDEGSMTAALDGGAGSLLANDSDPEGNNLRVRRSPAAGVAHGTLRLYADGTFQYMHDGSETTSDGFVYVVCDDGAPSRCSEVAVTIAIVPVNDPPLALGDAIAVAEGDETSVLIGGGSSVLANDSDAESALVVDPTPVEGVSFGTLTLAADGTFTYVHDGSDTTSDGFAYQVCDTDPNPSCDVASVTITITPVNDPPVAADDAIALDEGASQNVLIGGAPSVLENDSDAEGDSLRASNATSVAPEHGTIRLHSDGTFEYQHDGSETTSDSFVYEVCDDGSPSACSSATVRITIQEVNDLPLAIDDAIELAEGATTARLANGDDSLLDNDSEAEGEPLAIDPSPVAGASHGTLTLDTDGTFTYVHDGGEATEDEFTYEVCDARNGCSQATVKIAITPVNDVPVAVDDTILVAEGETETLLANDDDSLLDNDSDAEAGALAVDTTPAAAPAHGVLVLHADGTFSYAHDGSETTADSFTYRVCDDGTPQECSEAAVAIVITQVNDAPVAVNESIAVDEGGSASTLAGGGSSLIANDTDVEGDALSLSAVPVDGPDHGTVTLNADGTFLYTHDGSETSSDAFTYQVCDGGTPSECSQGSVSVTIANTNDPPRAVPDEIIVAEGQSRSILVSNATSVSANDTDEEGQTLTVNVTPVSDVLHGTLVLNADGTFAYTHDGTDTTSDEFSYEVCDLGPPSECSVGTVTIQIIPVNDPPIAVGDALTIEEGGSATTLTGGAGNVMANDSDPESGVLSVASLADAPKNGTVTLDPSGTFVYVHDGSETLSDSFSYQLCDDGTPVECVTGTVTITIAPVNDEPLAEADATEVDEGGTVTALSGGEMSVLANDEDPEQSTLTASVFEDVAHGTLALNTNGTFSYTHDGGESTNDAFSYQVCEAGPTPLCTIQTVSITIRPINDAPIAGEYQYSAQLDQLLSVTASDVTLGSNDTDPEGDSLSITTFSAASSLGGSVHVNMSDGTFSYQPPAGQGGADSFTYTITDDGSPPESTVVTVHISVSTNTAPQLSGGPFTVELPKTNGDTVGSMTVDDPNAGQTHTYEITAGNDAGIFAIDPSTGVITFDDASSAAGGDYTLTIEVTDDGSPPMSDAADVTITLAEEPGPVNDGPLAVLPGVTGEFNIADNDALGTPAAQITSFGGGSLGGQVTDHPTGATAVDFAGGTITLDRFGNLTVQAETPGTYTFDYRLDNGIERDGTVTIIVCISMDVGDTFMARPEEVPQLCVGNPSVNGSTQYVFIPINVNPAADYTLGVLASGITSLGAAPSPGAESLTDTHVAFRTAHHADVAARIGQASGGTGIGASIPAGVPDAGDVWTLNVDVTNACTEGTAQTATVKFVGTHSIVVVDDDNPAGGFSDEELEGYAWAFDNVIYPTLADWYGEPSDLDGNERVVLFITAAMNRLSPAGAAANPSRTLTRDLLSQEECPTSNAGEIIYLLAPDPTGEINSNVRTKSFAFIRPETLHEYGHLLVDHARLDAGAPFEEPWLDEGLAAAASELVFYQGPLGHVDLNPLNIPAMTDPDAVLQHYANIQLSNLSVGPAADKRVRAFNTYANLNFTRLREFLVSPRLVGIADSSTDATSQRGIAWAFLRYAADRYANGSLIAERAFWQGLLAGPSTGLTNLEDQLNEDPLQWIRDFLIALYVDDTQIPGLDEAALPYQTKSWNYRSVYGGLGGFPLQVPSFMPEVEATFTLARGGTSSYVLFGVPMGQIGTLTLTPPGVPNTNAWYLIFRRPTPPNQ